MEDLQQRVEELEKFVTDLGYATKKRNSKSRFEKRNKPVVLNNLTRAYCIETIDPFAENRIRFYHPQLHDPETKINALPFARPVSSMGGFDDSGMNWVPPAGSIVVIFFENGSRRSPYYIGTTWFRNRGENGNNYPFPSREWQSVYQGKRGGYLLGRDDDSQVYPPWNTESYNTYDPDERSNFQEDTQAQRRITYPNIYGFKTPEKHMVKMVDGNAKCNRRWKRMELMSGCGNWMIMKDDHLHYGGQWAHPSCPPENAGGADISICSEHDGGEGDNIFLTDIHGEPIEGNASCEGQSQSSSILGGHSSTPGNPPEDPTTQFYQQQGGANPFFKHQNECRPYKGPGTPQNNRCDLPQSGVQILSISGHTMVMDDSVEEPQGVPEWQRSTEDFDFGCNDKYLGRFYIKSATGHEFTMSDVEEKSRIRGNQNYIRLKSANGNRIELNDHTEGDSTSGSCPPNVAGEDRGIHLESTSKHTIKLIDHLNEQCAPVRSSGGTPQSKATQAYVQIRSGYGLEMRFNDDNSQEETQQQWIQITHPQCIDPNNDTGCNQERGPHFMRFQGRPQGEPGIIFLRAGGHSIRQTYDQDIVLVGDRERNPSDKFTYVSKRFVTSTEEIHFRYTGESHIFFAEEQIHLLAGRDCPPSDADNDNDGEPDNTCAGPCSYGVIIARCPTICPLTGILHWTEKSVSERVFASGAHPCQAQCSQAQGEGIDAGDGCDGYESAMAAATTPPDC